ncbi:MAG: hypothetical protein Tsb009_10100 [Planctomycetaceae bacterium]
MSRRFTNLDTRHRPPNPAAVFRWAILDRILRRRRVQSPGEPATRVSPDLDLIHNAHGQDLLTWIGHSSFLLSVSGLRVLIDPVFSKRIGVFYKRHGLPGLLPEQLPPIDVLLISHNHYDHLDEPSLLPLRRDISVLVPAGLGNWFRTRGFSRVTELQWWESDEVHESRITLVPARHWSRRSLFDMNCSLWGGFVIEGPGAAIYHAGDSAWFDGFVEIGQRFPNLDVAILPIGGYEPSWFMDRNHMNPEQAGQAFLDIGARLLVPMHWGTFQMTDEPLTEPATRLKDWWRNNEPDNNRKLYVPAVGETQIIGKDR